MQVILDSSFARPGSTPIWGGKKGEFRDWTTKGDAWARHAIFFRRKEDYVRSLRRRPKNDGKERRKADESNLRVILKDAEQN